LPNKKYFFIKFDLYSFLIFKLFFPSEILIRQVNSVLPQAKIFEHWKTFSKSDGRLSLLAQISVLPVPFECNSTFRSLFEGLRNRFLDIATIALRDAFCLLVPLLP